MRSFIYLFALVLSTSSFAVRLECPTPYPEFTEVFQNQDDLNDEEDLILYELPIHRNMAIKRICPGVARIGNMVRTINAKIKGSMILPHPFILNFMGHHFNANVQGRVMNVPLVYSMNELTKHPKYTETIWAHEYGHMIFQENLKNTPNWKLFIKFDDDREELKLKAALAWNQGSYWSSVADRLPEGPEKDEAIKKKRSYWAQEDVFKAKMSALSYPPKYRYRGDFFIPFHEFFADVVAIQYAQKGDGLYKAMYLSALLAQGLDRDHLPTFTNRDFTNRHNRIDVWKSEDKDAHHIYTPARYWIWENYLERPTNLVLKPGIGLKKIFDILVREMDSLVRAEKPFEDYDVIELNRRLIQRFEKELK